jgi:peptide-methionine (R)-S-oxide reductase
MIRNAPPMLVALFAASLGGSLLAGCSGASGSAPAGGVAPVPQSPGAAPSHPYAPSATPPSTAGGAAATPEKTMPNPSEKVVRSDAEWKRILTPEQYRILREKGTERPWTGEYNETMTPGTYECAGCGAVLFRSEGKFIAHCGWPAFDRAADGVQITETRDESHGMVRTEVTCPRCDGHLGHLFDDGPTETGMRYCINSASIKLKTDPGGEKDAPKK